MTVAFSAAFAAYLLIHIWAAAGPSLIVFALTFIVVRGMAARTVASPGRTSHGSGIRPPVDLGKPSEDLAPHNEVSSRRPRRQAEP